MKQLPIIPEIRTLKHSPSACNALAEFIIKLGSCVRQLCQRLLEVLARKSHFSGAREAVGCGAAFAAVTIVCGSFGAVRLLGSVRLWLSQVGHLGPGVPQRFWPGALRCRRGGGGGREEEEEAGEEEEETGEEEEAGRTG